ncbi:MFS transporter [Effusibacillus dendaii]|uniref:Bcr/CflA family multidrug efflux MFS transporter n=1 Tax=Effusibacillus dendaii TaxID=2743772 RepID=A0A7I8DFA9_9BACL|nr:MFS transporter [Effusibacillus dendaii]BCJ87240.1 Bcr/CflA family multidrug efflux MFS transporter [Effusibacillus dendaii]
MKSDLSPSLPHTTVQRDTALGRNVLIALLWALGLSGFLVNADNRSLSPILPAVASDLHVGESTAGLLITAYSIPYGLFQLFYGPLADRIGKIRTITLAFSLFAISTFSCSFMSSFNWMFVMRIVTGMFAAGIIPIALAQIGDSFPIQERPKAIAFFMSMSTSGQALGIVIGGIVSQFVSWKMLFVMTGVLAVPAVLLFFRQRSTHSVEEKALIPLRERYRLIFSKKRSWAIYAMIFLEGATFFGAFTFLGLYGHLSLGLNFFTIGLLTALYSAGAFGGSFLISVMVRKIGQPQMPLFGGLLMALGYGVIWLLPTVTALTIGFVLLGVGYSFCHSALQTFATELLPQARATAMSVFAFCLFLGTGLGPVWLGEVYDLTGMNGLLEASTLSTLLFAILCGLLFARRKTESPKTV